MFLLILFKQLYNYLCHFSLCIFVYVYYQAKV